jgi:RimJ/RimL family protein N-acetyltransferase
MIPKKACPRVGGGGYRFRKRSRSTNKGFAIMAWLEPITLRGQHATLEPLSHDHRDGLAAAAEDGELWRLWYTNVPSSEQMAAEIDRRLKLRDAGSMLPFVVIENATRAPVGMTTFMNADAVNRRLEIGGTWYAKRVQRTAVNTECKLALLTHAFETLNCIAVEFRTHFFNQPSRRGIERLGAKLNGSLRNHSILPNGTYRDNCVYSIIAGEWPTVKAHLSWNLIKPREQAQRAPSV